MTRHQVSDPAANLDSIVAWWHPRMLASISLYNAIWGEQERVRPKIAGSRLVIGFRRESVALPDRSQIRAA
jgi:hypothetical protein